MDIQKNEPFTNNQIQSEKPSVPKSNAPLKGKFANSMNGGHNRTIFWKRIMAGEKHENFIMQAFIKMLTPKTPVYQNLKCTARVYFVPDSAVWTNAEKFIAQNASNANYNPKEIPNMSGKTIPTAEIYEWDGKTEPTKTGYTNFSNTTAWRDSFASSYIPRAFIQGIENTGTPYVMPKYNILALRGAVAIYNNYLRNKEYEPAITEFKGDTVSNEEWSNYIQPMGLNHTGKTLDYYQMRARKDNSYYTNYKTTLQGFEEEMPTDDENLLSKFVSWENKLAEMRSQSENAQKNDWEILAEIRGSKILTEGKVQLIGKKTFNLNYSAITQSTYNVNEDIEEQFQVMGTQGAYSYTEVTIPLYNHMEFNEEGTIHIMLTATADTVFERSFDRTMLNVGALDVYRPDLKNEKEDVLYRIEMGTGIPNSNPNYENAIGFKRRFSEYFKMPNIIAGDMTSQGYFQTGIVGSQMTKNTLVLSNKSFQFFENDPFQYQYQNEAGTIKTIQKKIWKDYTDLHINENQAIMNPIDNISQEDGTTEIYLHGQNQIFFMGEMICNATLPIQDGITENFTQWGEK